MVHEGTVVRYEANVPSYARGGLLEQALVASAARWVTRKELTSLVVRSVVQIAGSLYYEVQVARRTIPIEIHAAVAQARMQTVYQLGVAVDQSIQETNRSITDPRVRAVVQGRLVSFLDRTAEEILGN